MNIKISNQIGAAINKNMIGLFFEDINYGLDGGLYAEMIENRSFEFVEASGVKDKYEINFDGLYGYSAYPSTEQGANLKIETVNPINPINPHYLEFTAGQNQLSFTNKAYDGINMKQGISYLVSFYAKAEDYTGQIEVRIQKDTEVITSAVVTTKVCNRWTRYCVELVAKKNVSNATFLLQLSQVGTVCFDFVSMMPGDAVLGLFRKDLVELLKDMKPGFLRFPGGCIIEGNTLDNRYQWKQSVGKAEERKANWNRWAVHDNNDNNLVGPYSHYNQSLGIGYYEYFLLCEYLGAEPLPVINVGLACQYQSSELIAIEDPGFQEYIEDALDLIEFANGPIDSKWGLLRMQMGHAKPFGLKMIGIGNEQWETKEVDFFKRYELFEQAIHERYPEIQLIGSAGPDVRTERYNLAWDYYRQAKKENYVYTVDEHYYMDPDWFIKNVDFYDNYPRDIKVFAGEYAAHVGWGMNRPELNNWKAALSEAAFLTGVERNADVVTMASYAPLFARLGYTQWSTDMIWFDGERSYGSPSYYVQKMFSTNMGTNLLQVHHDQNEIPYSVLFDQEEQAIIIKLANVTDHDVNVTLDFDFNLQEKGDVYYIEGKDEDVNTLDASENISIKNKRISVYKGMDYQVHAKSFHVVKIYCKVLNIRS
jgi:alpha-L-arabinofuranosidase